MEENIKKKTITKNPIFIILVSIFITIIAIMSITLFFYGFNGVSDFFYFQGNLKLTAGDFPTFSEVLSYSISIISIIVTTVFSHLLYNISKKSNDLSNENLALTKKIEERQTNLEEREKKKVEEILKSNAFIIKNDLETCFKFIFETLVIYAKENSKFTINLEQRSEWLKAWKPLNKTYMLQHNWRESLQLLHPKLNKRELQIIYDIYISLESTKEYINTCKNVHEKVEYLPREDIFNETFLENYSTLRDFVDFYDSTTSEISNTKKRITELNMLEKFSSTDEKELIIRKNYLSTFENKLEESNVTVKIIEKSTYFDSLSYNRIMLNKKFNDILEKLEGIYEDNRIR